MDCYNEEERQEWFIKIKLLAGAYFEDSAVMVEYSNLLLSLLRKKTDDENTRYYLSELKLLAERNDETLLNYAHALSSAIVLSPNQEIKKNCLDELRQLVKSHNTNMNVIMCCIQGMVNAIGTFSDLEDKRSFLFELKSYSDMAC